MGVPEALVVEYLDAFTSLDKCGNGMIPTKVMMVMVVVVVVVVVMVMLVVTVTVTVMVMITIVMVKGISQSLGLLLRAVGENPSEAEVQVLVSSFSNRRIFRSK